MNKIEVLHIGKYYHPYKGGMEESIFTLVNSLKDKINFRVLVANHNSGTSAEKDNNAEIIRLASIGAIFSQPITPGLFFWLKKSKADIIHLHWPNPWAMICYLMARPAGKLVITYNCDIARQWFLMLFLAPLLGHLLKMANVIVVTSNDLLDSSSFLKRYKDKCRLIPHGIDLDRFKITEGITKEADVIRKIVNKPILLYVGRLVYYKGLEYLIKAMKGIDAHLFIIGKGWLRLKLELLAMMRGVNNKISWMGGVPENELLVYYQACDIFVFPSCEKAEGFGLAMLEAFAFNKPVVSTNLPTGVRTINLDRVTGLVVPYRDNRALKEAINELLFSQELRTLYGLNGRNRAADRFSKKIVADKFLTLYQTMVNS